MAIKRFANVNQLRPCHILFISSSERKRIPEIMEKLDGQHVLTVAEMRGFAERGGMINFVSVGNKVKFEINSKTARSQGLRISSRLMRVAKVVNTNSSSRSQGSDVSGHASLDDTLTPTVRSAGARPMSDSSRRPRR